jgi:hypothetical protein
VSYHQLTDDGDDEWMREELRDALYDAMAGSKQWLIELQHSTVFDPDTVLAEIFDMAYKE